MRHFLLLAILGCGTTGGGPGGDDSSSVDARSQDGGTAGLTEMNVTCADYVHTAVAADGSRIVSTGKHAVIDGISPADHFVVSFCYPASFTAFDANCAAGSTCTGAVYPPGQHCYASQAGQFIGGKLIVDCGSTYATFAPNGAMTGSGGTVFENVKLYR